MSEIIEIEVSNLKPGDNPREKIFDNEDEKNAFVQTVESVGYLGLDPIIIYETDNKHSFEVDDGHRRLDAASILGWKTLRCIVAPRPRTEAQKYFKRVRRNVNQKRLSGYEKYKVVIKGVRELEFSMEKVSIDSGISRGEISRIVAIATSSELVLYLQNGGHLRKAYYLSRIKDETLRTEILQHIDDYSVAQLRIIVKDGISYTEPETPIESPRIGPDDEGDSSLDDSRPLVEKTEELDEGEETSLGGDGAEGSDEDSSTNQPGEGELDVTGTEGHKPETGSASPPKPDYIVPRNYCLRCGHIFKKGERTGNHECNIVLRMESLVKSQMTPLIQNNLGAKTTFSRDLIPDDMDSPKLKALKTWVEMARSRVNQYENALMNLDNEMEET